MHADISRITFRPDRHYSAVIAQQGRVQLDADANEHVKSVKQLADAEKAETVVICAQLEAELVALEPDPRADQILDVHDVRALREATGTTDDPMERHTVRQFLIAGRMAADRGLEFDRAFGPQIDAELAWY